MSDTPIYDRLALEYEWYGMPPRILLGLDQCTPEEWSSTSQHIWALPEEGTVSVEILPDTTNFLTGMRVGGRRAGRTEWLSAMQANLDRIARAMTLPSLATWVERSDLYPKYSAEVQELSRTTGWSLEESADMYERVAKWAADAIKEDNIKALNRSRMSKQNHYPTSTPPWARRKR
ncbi:hypothetical protein BLJ79_21530 [Arthrobacter sp. UCD-GKA]|uniref:hypothetical protein n=1 Tax=Arthrobacter sp. UCD-GKA TaxID=1913576 RepID=UPI0008DD8EFB|nr:hypothetical protein [Arthrobacter sp. UCD-GKA]OIH81944.1 hypothetical protein BLJ79_21530 [Arthrobacter sp. UCD-GKA]